MLKLPFNPVVFVVFWIFKICNFPGNMSSGFAHSALSEEDVLKLLATQAHLGSTNLNFQMQQYVYKRRFDGEYFLIFSFKVFKKSFECAIFQVQTSSTSRRPGRNFFLLLALSPLLRTQLTSSSFRLDHTLSVLFSSSLLTLELPPSSVVSPQVALPTRSRRPSRSQDSWSSLTQESTTRYYFFNRFCF